MRRKGVFFTGTDLRNLRNDENSFTLAPYVAYHWRIAGSLYFDLSGVLACGFNNYKHHTLWTPLPESDVRETVFTVMASSGFTYVVNRRLQVEMRLGGLSWSMGKERSANAGYVAREAKSVVLDWNNGIDLGVAFRF